MRYPIARMIRDGNRRIRQYSRGNRWCRQRLRGEGGSPIFGPSSVAWYPPVLTQHQVTQVAFQNRYRGWATDDLLVGCTDESGTVRKIAIQSKRGFTVSASNPECIKTFSGFWTDFRAPGLFDPELDILVLVVQRATKVIMKGLGGLLACARAASDHTDFRDRFS